MTVKRVSIRGKFVVQARDKKGRIVDQRRWNPKSFNLNDAVKLFNENKTLHENRERKPLVNKVEVQNLSKIGKEKFKVTRPRRVFQWLIIANITFEGSTRRVEARSKQRDWNSNAEARADAMDALLITAKNSFDLPYDLEPLEGAQVNILQEGAVYYTDI